MKDFIIDSYKGTVGFISKNEVSVIYGVKSNSTLDACIKDLLDEYGEITFATRIPHERQYYYAHERRPKNEDAPYFNKLRNRLEKEVKEKEKESTIKFLITKEQFYGQRK